MVTLVRMSCSTRVRNLTPVKGGGMVFAVERRAL
jgi:hypothetical protein